MSDLKEVFLSKQYMSVLKDFLNDFFDLNIEYIKIGDLYNITHYSNDPSQNDYFQTMIDLFCTLADDSKIIVKTQCESIIYFIEKNLHNDFLKFCSDCGNQEPRIVKLMDSCYPVYMLNILNYNHFEDERAIREFVLCEEVTGERLIAPNSITIGYFELLKDDDTISDKLKYWKRFFLDNNNN